MRANAKIGDGQGALQSCLCEKAQAKHMKTWQQNHTVLNSNQNSQPEKYTLRFLAGCVCQKLRVEKESC